MGKRSISPIREEQGSDETEEGENSNEATNDSSGAWSCPTAQGKKARKHKKIKTEGTTTETPSIQTYADVAERRPDNVWLMTQSGASTNTAPAYGFNNSKAASEKRSMSPIQEEQGSDETEGDIQDSVMDEEGSSWPPASSTHSKKSRKHKKRKTEGDSAVASSELFEVPQVW